MEDSRIVELYLMRNEAAIQYTSEKYGQKLLRLSFRLCQEMETAEECENDTYVKAWNSIPPHEPREYFYVFLARITRSITLDRIRNAARKKRNGNLVELNRELEECVSSDFSLETEMEQRQLVQLINKFLRKQTEEKRNIFIRRYWYMDSIEQIAERFSISESKVKSILYRIRGKLKAFLEREGYLQ